MQISSRELGSIALYDRRTFQYRNHSIYVRYTCMYRYGTGTQPPQTIITLPVGMNESEISQ